MLTDTAARQDGLSAVDTALASVGKVVEERVDLSVVSCQTPHLGGLPIFDMEDLHPLPFCAGPVRRVGYCRTQRNNMIVAADDVVNLGGWLPHRFSLACKQLQHHRLALISTGPLAVTPNMPNNVISHVPVDPFHIAAIEGLKAVPDQSDVGVLIMSQLCSPSLSLGLALPA